MKRKCLKNMARPEGFEPPAYRFEVCSNTEPQELIGKRTPIFLDFATFFYPWFPALLSQCGSKMVASILTAYRYIHCGALETFVSSGVYKGLLPACYHIERGP